MNLTFRGLAFLAIALLVLGLMAAPAWAAQDAPNSPICFAASFLQNIAGDRSKIIQLSIVFVLIGIALLFKK